MRFSVGWVLSQGFRIWLRNFVPFVLLSLAVHLPLVVYTGLSIGRLEHAEDPVRTAQIWSYVVSFGSMVLGLVSSGAIIYGVVQELRGARTTIGDSISMGLRRFVPVLGTAVLVAICIILGFVALIVPGIILSCMLYVAVPVAVMEPGAGALSRSKQLTDGYKGSIFGMLLLLGIIERIATYVLEKTLVDTLAGFKLYAYAVLGIDIVWGALGAVVAAVTYATLRNDREGADAEELARIFG